MINFTRRFDKVYSTLLKSGFDTYSLIGLFLWGDMPATVTSSTKIEMIALILPSLDDLYNNNYKQEVRDIENNTVRICDIRLMKELLLNAHLDTMRSLFSRPHIINTKLQIFNDIAEKTIRDEIPFLNRKNIYLFFSAKLTNIMSMPFSHKNLVEICRILYFLQQYSINEDCLIEPSLDNEQSFLWKEKCAIFIKNEHQEHKRLAKEMFDECQNIINEGIAKAEREDKTNNIVDRINKNIVDIFRKSQAMLDDNNHLNFLSSLTEKEKTALDYIYSKFNENKECNISIVEAIKDTSLSRTVFSSTLGKMQKYKIAEIANQGVKGTYIKILPF